MPMVGLSASSAPHSQGRIALLSGACLEALLPILTVNGQVQEAQREKGMVTASPTSSVMRVSITP